MSINLDVSEESSFGANTFARAIARVITSRRATRTLETVALFVPDPGTWGVWLWDCGWESPEGAAGAIATPLGEDVGSGEIRSKMLIRPGVDGSLGVEGELGNGEAGSLGQPGVAPCEICAIWPICAV